MTDETRHPQEETAGTRKSTDRQNSREAHEATRHLQDTLQSAEVKLKLNQQQVEDFDSALDWFARNCRKFTDSEWYWFFNHLKPYADPKELGLNISLTTEQFQTAFTEAVSKAAETFDCRLTPDMGELRLSIVERYILCLSERAKATREHLDDEGSLPFESHLGLANLIENLSPIVRHYG